MDNKPLDAAPLLRYALFGAGASIASTHLEALARLPGTQIVGMADVSPATSHLASMAWQRTPTNAHWGLPRTAACSHLLAAVCPN